MHLSEISHIIVISSFSKLLLFNVLGFLSLRSASEPLALLVPVLGDIHVFFFCGWEGYISLGR